MSDDVLSPDMHKSTALKFINDANENPAQMLNVLRECNSVESKTGNKNTKCTPWRLGETAHKKIGTLIALNIWTSRAANA